MASEDPTEMVWEKKLVGRPAGTQHGRSRDDDGSSSSNLFVPGSKGVKAQAKIRDIDEDEEDSLPAPEPVYNNVIEQRSELAEFAAEVVSHFIDVAVAELKPHVKRWWDEDALPAIKSRAASARNKISAARKADSQAATAELAAVVEAEYVGPSGEVDVSPGADTVTMSSTEAQQRLVAALLARAFSDEQMRMLLNAQIEDADGPEVSQVSLERLTPRDVEQHVNLVLEANPHLVQEFAKLLWGDRTVDGATVPLQSESVTEAPRLPRREA